ncbi:MAG: ATP-binding protein [Candidatus Fermentibacteraceae bacterium]
MRELVVISGKGGTGKTSVAASLAVLADRPVIADCDVDAADLHLVFQPVVREQNEFYSGHQAVIRSNTCTGCGKCLSVCRFEAVGRVDTAPGDSVFFIDSTACEGCGACVRFCPAGAIDFPERHCGQWMVSDTRVGPMVHGRLGTAAENSGRLVSLVRSEARRVAAADNRTNIIIDGPPGIGCPVIASITGSTMVLVVTEPTLSGEHDLKRVMELTSHFQIPTWVAMNKWDINPGITLRVEREAVASGAKLAGRIRYDPGVTDAQMNGNAVVETDAPSAYDMAQIWENLGFQA